MIDWWIDCLFGWLIGWLVGWLMGWLFRSFVRSLVRWMVGWLVGCLVGWLVATLTLLWFCIVTCSSGHHSQKFLATAHILEHLISLSFANSISWKYNKNKNYFWFVLYTTTLTAIHLIVTVHNKSSSSLTALWRKFQPTYFISHPQDGCQVNELIQLELVKCWICSLAKETDARLYRCLHRNALQRISIRYWRNEFIWNCHALNKSYRSTHSGIHTVSSA